LRAGRRPGRIRKGKVGRGRLVGMVAALRETGCGETRSVTGRSGRKAKAEGVPDDGVRSIVEMDRPVGELKKLVGTSSAGSFPPPVREQTRRC
jgi:hypothetical protein